MYIFLHFYFQFFLHSYNIINKTELEYYGKNKELENPAIYNELINQMYNKEWIVYCKEPFQNANSVIQYLGRYTHRVAISNERNDSNNRRIY